MFQEVTARDIEKLLEEELGITKTADIIVHANMSSIGPVRGEEAGVAAALLAAAGTVVMPAFTYQTQIIPQTGPPDNGIEYGSGDAQNARAQIFRPDLPIHPDFASVAEVLRKDNETLRSTHPILSFIAQGPDAEVILSAQTRQNPLSPIALLEARGGYALLMGLDHRHNYSLHLAAQRAGRKTYIRWALTLDDIEELPNIPGPMEGFNDIWRDLEGITRVAQVGLARCELIPLRQMLLIAEDRMRSDPDYMRR